MGTAHLPAFIEALRQPEQYSHPVDEDVRVLQTHISYVLIAGQYVYKFKKPVDFGFLDFTTLDRRGHFCRRELELNRRLCPDIYLDVVQVTRNGDSYALQGSGEVIEYGVQMVRMPEEMMMPRLMEAGKLGDRHLDAIIDKLVPFYESAAGDEAIRSYGRAEAVGVNVMENFEQTESFVGSTSLSKKQFEVIRDYARTLLSDGQWFEHRIAEGRIRDCHGDLYSANICLDSKVHIFDCIEFNERFRYSDIAADVAFLAMDLEYHGLSRQADYFLKRFAAQANDPTLLEHVPFYQCYRAYVRGKIGMFTAADPAMEPDVAERCREQAKWYFELAERYATQSR